jgi:hypothetical protein
MAKLSRDLATPPGGTSTLHARETLMVSGTLGSNGAEVILPADGAACLAIDLRGTFSMTIEISGTIDGTNWIPIPVRPINVAAISYVAAITGTAAGLWAGKCPHYRAVRARVTAYTSGAATVTLVADNAPLDDSLQGMITTGVGTVTGASGAAATLTLAAPGAGLRHYLTYVAIVRSAAAVLTASATPVVVTTTNIPTALAFTFGADAAVLGVDKVIREDFAYPLAVTAQNTATTIVAPATTGVIWRLTAGFYVAP